MCRRESAVENNFIEKLTTNTDWETLFFKIEKLCCFPLLVFREWKGSCLCLQLNNFFFKKTFLRFHQNIANDEIMMAYLIFFQDYTVKMLVDDVTFRMFTFRFMLQLQFSHKSCNCNRNCKWKVLHFLLQLQLQFSHKNCNFNMVSLLAVLQNRSQALMKSKEFAALRAWIYGFKVHFFFSRTK